jgi:riboflavin-specific deaminase-like protein
VPESPLSGGCIAIARLVESVLKAHCASPPAVTLSWAQSLDGAIAPADGKRTVLSGSESLVLTHELRKMHGAIMVGIGTVIADDPQLTVRLVEGQSPQPVVLDSHLRFPLGARLLASADRRPWIFHAEDAPSDKARELVGRGASLFALPAAEAGLPLAEVLRVLRTRGIESLMVEGGARVLRSFVADGLAHQAVITVSPVKMEGIRIFDSGPHPVRVPAFAEMSQERYGPDVVTWGRFA